MIVFIKDKAQKCFKSLLLRLDRLEHNKGEIYNEMVFTNFDIIFNDGYERYLIDITMNHYIVAIGFNLRQLGMKVYRYSMKKKTVGLEDGVIKVELLLETSSKVFPDWSARSFTVIPKSSYETISHQYIYM